MSEKSSEDLLNLVKSKVKSYPDFPKPGIVFKDIFGALADPDGLSALMELLRRKATKEWKGKVDFVVGLDARLVLE